MGDYRLGTIGEAGSTDLADPGGSPGVCYGYRVGWSCAGVTGVSRAAIMACAAKRP